jgi:hypothetical protein
LWCAGYDLIEWLMDRLCIEDSRKSHNMPLYKVKKFKYFSEFLSSEFIPRSVSTVWFIRTGYGKKNRFLESSGNLVWNRVKLELTSFSGPPSPLPRINSIRNWFSHGIDSVEWKPGVLKSLKIRALEVGLENIYYQSMQRQEVRVSSSVADPGCFPRSRILDPNFFHSASKNLSILTQKNVF